MRVPDSLAGLLDQGIIQEIVRPLMSGKEAQVYLVTAGGQPRVAKIYKDAQQRSFKQRAEYTEGRRVRSSRDQRAMQKRTRYGRKQDEAAWKSAEVDMIYRLRYAGVRVPEPFAFVDGVLLMELVQDADGLPAPRLAEVDFDPHEAREIYQILLQEVVKMLCAGVVHGDLSEYNVLLAESGPIIIDFPQSVDAAANQSAKKLLLRDVDNLTRFLQRFDHRARRAPYGQEIWGAYERNRLTPEMVLTGTFQRSTYVTDTSSLLDEIEAAERDEAQRRRSLGLPPRRREVMVQPSGASRGRGDGRRERPDGRAPSERRGGGPPRDARAGAHSSPTPRASRPDGRAPSERRGGGPSGEARKRTQSAPGSALSAQSASAQSAPQRAPSPHQVGQQDDAPPRRRRRRRKKPGNGAAPEMTSQPQRDGDANRARNGGSHEPRAPQRAQPPNGARAAEGDAQQGGAETRDPSAPPKRRRRRRRSGTGQPPNAGGAV